MTYPHLEAAPEDHLSTEFINYLRENNVVVLETRQWIVIENVKYHTPERAHHTAFPTTNHANFRKLPRFHHERYPGWEILIKPANKRTVKRWHVHFIEPV